MSGNRVSRLRELHGSSGSWKWSSPTDRGSTRWYLVIDNLDHARRTKDQGALGGSTAGVLQSTQPLAQDEPFTLFSGITHLSPGALATLLGPFDADSGTAILKIYSLIDGGRVRCLPLDDSRTSTDYTQPGPLPPE